MKNSLKIVFLCLIVTFATNCVGLQAVQRWVVTFDRSVPGDERLTVKCVDQADPVLEGALELQQSTFVESLKLLKSDAKCLKFVVGQQGGLSFILEECLRRLKNSDETLTYFKEIQDQYGGRHTVREDVERKDSLWLKVVDGKTLEVFANTGSSASLSSHQEIFSRLAVSGIWTGLIDGLSMFCALIFYVFLVFTKFGDEACGVEYGKFLMCCAFFITGLIPLFVQICRPGFARRFFIDNTIKDIFYFSKEPGNKNFLVSRLDLIYFANQFLKESRKNPESKGFFYKSMLLVSRMAKVFCAIASPGMATLAYDRGCRLIYTV